MRKYYLNGEAGGGGVYLWQSEAAARAWYTPEWEKRMEAAFGAKPTVTYYDNHVVVDNEAAVRRSPRSEEACDEEDAKMQKRRWDGPASKSRSLGYGAGAVGGLLTKGAAADQERAMARAIEAGINYFDTAALYGNGESERNLGRVLKALKADVVRRHQGPAVGRRPRRRRQGDRAGHGRQPEAHGPRPCRSLPAAQSAGRQGRRRPSGDRHRPERGGAGAARN